MNAFRIGARAAVAIERTGGISLREQRFTEMLAKQRGGIEYALSLLKMGADSNAGVERRLESINRELSAEDNYAMGRHWRSPASLLSYGTKLSAGAFQVTGAAFSAFNFPSIAPLCQGAAAGADGISSVASSYAGSDSAELQGRGRLTQSVMETTSQSASRKQQEASELERNIKEAAQAGIRFLS